MKKTKILVFVLLVALCLSCFAACNKTPQELVDARDYLYNQYKEFDGKATPADFNRVGAVMINGTKYPIEWTVEVKTEGQSESVKVVKNEDGTVTVDVDEKAAVEISYDLTATISNAKGKTITVTFHHTVPQWRELTWAEYMATEKGQAVVIKGKVASISSKSTGDKYNLMYIYDNDGGYYVYSLTEDPLTTYPNLALGMTVQVTGEKDIYNGTHEVKNATFTVIDAESTIEFADITDIFAATDDMKSETLTKKAYMPVTIKNVIIGDIDEANSYYYFTIGASKSYLRISSSDNMLSEAETKAFKDGFAALKGKYATVKGLATVYSGSFYIQVITADAAVEQAAPEKDPAGQIADVKGRLAIDTKINGSGRTFTLPTQDTVYTSVNIAWAASSDIAKIEDGKVTYTFTEDGTVKLTATLTHATDATVSDTKEFEVTLSLGTAATVKQIYDASKGDTTLYILTGYVVAAGGDHNTPGNFVFADATGSIFSYEKMAVEVGDYVQIVGTKDVQFDLTQFKTISFKHLDGGNFVEATPEEINVADVKVDGSDLYTNKYYKIVSGTVKLDGKYINLMNGETKMVSLYANDALKAELTAKEGKEVVVYGYSRGVNTKNAYWQVQVTKVEDKPKTDAEKLAEAKEALTSVTADGGSEFADSFTLVTEGANGTKISWAIKEEGITALTISGANATVVKPEVDVNVTLIATISIEGSGEAPVTKEFPITITATIPTYTVTITAVEGATIVVKTGETVVESGATFNKGTEFVITVTVDSLHTLSAVKNGDTVLAREADGSYKFTLAADANITVEVANILTITEFKALAESATGTVVGIVTNIDSKATWLQNAEGDALYVYGTGLAGVAIGKQVVLSGTRAEYKGLAQLKDPVVVSVEDTETVISATTIDEAAYKALVANDASKLVNVSGLVYVSGTATADKGGSLTFKLGETNVTVRVEKGDADALNTAALSKLAAGDEINIKNANVGWFNSAQIAIYSADQIEFVMNVSATIDKTEVLIGETAKVTAKISPAFMAETVTVTYESSNTEVATVDGNGVVNGIGEGDAVITVRAGEKSATVNVTVVATATQYSVSYSASANGSITSVKAGEVDVASGSKVDVDTVITITVAPAEGYRLASYTIGEGEADTSVVGKTSFTLTITGDTVITVSFEAVPVVAASITMPPANKTDCETNTYDNTQVLKNADGVEWTTENFSNNNWGWSSIRCGRKKDASVASIYTNAAIANAVKTVAITFDKAQNLNKVNSAKIIVATNKEFTEGVQEIDILSMIKVGEVKIAITTPTANCFYKIVFDCAAAGSNGSIGITSIQYIA